LIFAAGGSCLLVLTPQIVLSTYVSFRLGIENVCNVPGTTVKHIKGCMDGGHRRLKALEKMVSRIFTTQSDITNTYDHRTLKTRLPVRSALFKQRTGGLVVRWVTTSEYPLLYVFFLYETPRSIGFIFENLCYPSRKSVVERYRRLIPGTALT
jgi:hypothetical protein